MLGSLIVLVKALYQALKCIIAHARIQLAGSLAIHDCDSIEQASQLLALCSRAYTLLFTRLLPACPLTQVLCLHTWWSGMARRRHLPRWEKWVLW